MWWTIQTLNFIQYAGKWPTLLGREWLQHIKFEWKQIVTHTGFLQGSQSV